MFCAEEEGLFGSISHIFPSPQLSKNEKMKKNVLWN